MGQCIGRSIAAILNILVPGGDRVDRRQGSPDVTGQLSTWGSLELDDIAFGVRDIDGRTLPLCTVA